jgi:hypothetical protein
MDAGSENGGLGSSDSRQQLAQELVACLGRDGAIHVCKLNGWEGILELLLADGAPDADLLPQH